MSIYQEIILHEYKNPRHWGKLTGFDKTNNVKNTLCGDELTLYVKVEDSRIVDVSFEGVGCAISIASASLLTDKIIGMSIDEVKKLNTETIMALIGVELSPNRLKCALLPLEGIQGMFE